MTAPTTAPTTAPMPARGELPSPPREAGRNAGVRRALFAAAAVALAAALAAAVFVYPRRSAEPIDLARLRLERATPESRYVNVGGVSVHYADEGGGPALVLVHGSFGSLHTFDAMVPLLRGHFRLIRYDQPPGGLSGPVPAAFAMTPEAFLHEFLARIGLTRVAVLGTSSGGIVAYRYASTYPDDVSALILSNVPPSAPVDNAAARRRQPWITQLSALACARFALPWSRTCWQDFLRSMYATPSKVSERLVAEYYDYNRRPDARQRTSMTAIMRDDAQVRGFLAHVRAPTLLVWSREDPVLPPPTAQLMASRLSAARVETSWLPAVGHYPPLEAPREVADLTARFLLRNAP